MSAFDSTFQAPIPGSSLTAAPGSMPHLKPPKYTDPHEALEYIWKQLTRPDMQRQIWQIARKGGTVWAITRALLFKMALSGMILMHMMFILAPVVAQMIQAICTAGKVTIKVNPKFRNKIREEMIQEKMQELIQKYGPGVPQQPKDAFSAAFESARWGTQSPQFQQQQNMANPQPQADAQPQPQNQGNAQQPQQQQGQQPQGQQPQQGQPAPTGLLGQAPQQGQ